MRPHPLTGLVAVAALAGMFFAGVSTYDFVARLDRQVHGIHCSFLPGIGSSDVRGTSGCHVAMMSPWSSVLRKSIWGGIPISLPAMAVFAFLLFWAVWLVLHRRQADPRATGFLLLATTLPLVASIIMGTISVMELGTACKLCIGIYISSAVAFGCALALWIRARRSERHVPSEETAAATTLGPTRVSWVVLGAALAFGVLFVVVPTVVYAVAAPNYSRFVGSCGSLPKGADPHHVLLPLGSQASGVPAVEVLDPLCPACRAFEQRLDASGLHEQLSRKVLLFPLDHDCNWMVDETIHAGACTVSEAMLCAGDKASDVLDWAFENQEAIKAAAAKDPNAAQRMVLEQFPQLHGCVGSAEARARLNRALRWAVNNRLPVLTPQLYVRGKRLCDEDTDLGMDFALSRMIEQGGSR